MEICRLDQFLSTWETCFLLWGALLDFPFIIIYFSVEQTTTAGRPGSSEVPRNPLTRWDMSSIPTNGIFLTKEQKIKNKNAQRVEND